MAFTLLPAGLAPAPRLAADLGTARPRRRPAVTRLALAAILVIAATHAHAGEPAELVGRWVMAAEPPTVLELRPGGTGTIDAQPLAWSVAGTRLTVTDPSGTDTTDWRLDGNRLVLTAAFGVEIVFTREDAKAGAAGSSLP